MAYDRCESCMGRKIVMGLGGMKKSCTACKGVGHIAKASDTDVRIKRKYTKPVKADVQTEIQVEA